MGSNQKSKALLFQPFPLLGVRKSYQNAIWISIFVTLFLLAFRPFDLHQVSGWPLINKVIGFGISTAFSIALCTFIISSLLPNIYNEDAWKVYHQLLYYVFVLLVVGIVNFAYAVFSASKPLGWLAFLDFEVSVTLVGIIPIAATVLAKYFILLKKNLKQAEELTKELKIEHPQVESKKEGDALITLSGENAKEDLSINPEQLLAIQSVDNYVEIFWEQNQALNKALLRSTLQNIESQIGNPDRFFKCHRSYLVNMEKVEKIDGNSQGYLLVLPLLKEPIPVSRLRNKDLKEWIQKSQLPPEFSGNSAHAFRPNQAHLS